jgi:DNA-binding transcriptional ArsR family regulator
LVTAISGEIGSSIFWMRSMRDTSFPTSAQRRIMRKTDPSLKDTKVDVQQTEIEQRLIKALNHPLRMRILMRLNLAVASPVEMARDLEEPLANVAYHTRVLVDLGCLELVRTEHRRGAIEHYYRAIVRPYFSDRDWGRLPVSARQTISEAVLQRVWADAATALQSGAFEARDDRHLSRTPLVVDEHGWREITAMLAQLLDRALQIEGESAARRREGEASAEVLSSLVLMHFTREPGPAQPAGS